MKSSLRKLRCFVMPDRKNKESREGPEALAEFRELKTAMRDIREMKGCYEGLLSASAMIANYAHELSQALQDMAVCLFKLTALNINEESKGILKVLGDVQYQLHELLDHYRAHISQTIMIPSESLLNELQCVEELKWQCAEKRKLYEYMRTQTAKGNHRNHKSDVFSSQQLKLTKEEYDEQATFLVCRLMSLKQGQSRTLLTQAARHHTAQLRLFRKGLASLEALDTHFKQVTEEQHIDHQLSEVDDDDGLSIEFGRINNERDESAKSKHLVQTTAEKIQKLRHSTMKADNKSLPFCPFKQTDGIEKTEGMQLETSWHKSVHPYALPTPDDAWNMGVTGATNNSCIRMEKRGVCGIVTSQCQMPTSEQSKNHEPGHKITCAKSKLNLCHAQSYMAGPLIKPSHVSKTLPFPNESSGTTLSRPMPLPSTVERMSILRSETTAAYDIKNVKRHGSGPLTGKSQSNKPVVKSGSPLSSLQVETSFKSAPHSAQASPFVSAKVTSSIFSSNLSPSHVSMLDQLPCPLTDSEKPSKSTAFITLSAPLVCKETEESTPYKVPRWLISRPASPFPSSPPEVVTQSLSKPSFVQDGQSQWIQSAEELYSPPHISYPFP